MKVSKNHEHTAVIFMTSATARRTEFLDANASCRPRIRQFSTMREMNAPSPLWTSGTRA